MKRKHRQRIVAAATIGGCAVTVLAVAQLAALLHHVTVVPAEPATENHGLAGLPATLTETAPAVGDRTVDAYAGYGTWVDVYDFVPAEASGTPAFDVAAVDEMARQGVRTLYLQAAKADGPSSGLLADPARVAQILVRAQRAGIRVVGWYLPKFGDIDRDLDHLQAIADFEVVGHRFDGVAVDIEWTESIADHDQRSRKLVELSERLRSGVGSDALGAIVLPPVQIEVVNPDKWPDFPWQELSNLYDVWLPMGYWTERRADSGYRDGAVYTAENLERLRDDLDDPEAVIHAVGGIGDEVTDAHAAGFADAVDEAEAIGGSIYDWRTLDRRLHAPLAEAINPASGPH
ncbi:MAG: hypothetical protein ACRD2C_01745 [Acidimicrobiales bacterium]